MLIPSSVSPGNQTRSYARIDYFDGFIHSRPNFHVATGQFVTRVLIDSATNSHPRDYAAGHWISGVEVRGIIAVLPSY